LNALYAPNEPLSWDGHNRSSTASAWAGPMQLPPPARPF
jgi:hypothetical protein